MEQMSDHSRLHFRGYHYFHVYRKSKNEAEAGKGRKCVRILLVSEDQEVCRQIFRVVGKSAELAVLSFADIGQEKELQYDMLIVDFDRVKVKEREFKIILEMNCMTKKPILVLLEQSSIADQFEVLSMGALDFLERPAEDEVYRQKLKELYQWTWYYGWKKEEV
jgi:FixJ family two-component response regulator